MKRLFLVRLMKVKRFFCRDVEKLAHLVTSFYVSGLIVVIGYKWSDLISLPLNELGDFLAGAFGPLAFLWLILGYRQQGKELATSSAALKEQVVELSKQFELQRFISDKQDKALDPLLELAYAGLGDRFGVPSDVFLLSNSGVDCRDICIRCTKQGEADDKPFTVVHLLKGGQHCHFNWDGVVEENTMWFVDVWYTRINGSRGNIILFVVKVAGRDPHVTRPLMDDLAKQRKDPVISN